MDEPPKVHHHKSKHRRNSSRKTNETDHNTNEVTIVQSHLNDEDVLKISTAASIEQPNVADEHTRIAIDEPKIILNDDLEVDAPNVGEEKAIQKGILGYMDREIKTLKKPQSFSDPTASPAQRSTRSRSSIEKSPRQKRSKSESRRRRERKLIAAGEMEVRQANETLMRYLKQCSEINDASLSGELEIDKSIDDRRVHRKTKSQRERRGHLNSGSMGSGNSNGVSMTSKTSGNGNNSRTSSFLRDRIPPSGLSSILQELAADVVPSHGEIYNPFTPVVSPTEGPPIRTDKMFIQTPRGFRSISDSAFLKLSLHNDPESHR